MTGLILGFDFIAGECHFVSRRVSESSEHNLAPNSWSDSTVLTMFWLSVFIIFIAVVVSIQRKRSGRYKDDGVSSILGKNGKSSKSSIEYVPVRLREDSHTCDDTNDCSGCDTLQYRSGSEEKLQLSANGGRCVIEDNYEDYDDDSSDTVPLVLNT